MKMNSTTITWLILALVWSIFMGVTAGSIGIGALYPPINLIAKPFVCPNGQMYFGEQTSNPLPGTTYTQITWICQDNQSGEKQELDIFPMSLYAGVFLGLLLFVVVVIIWYFVAKREPPRASSQRNNDWKTDKVKNFNQSGGRDGETLARMKELKELRDANSISDAEYQKKRAEILKEL